MVKNKTQKLLIIWPGYRTNNKAFFDQIKLEQSFQSKVLWVRKHRDDDMPNAEWLERIDSSCADMKGIRVNDFSIISFFKLFRTIWKELLQVDAVFTSTQAPVHSKIAFALAKLTRKPIFVLVQQWVDDNDVSLFMKLYKKLDKLILRYSNVVFVHGKNQRDYLLRLNINESSIRTLPFLSDDLALLHCDTETLKKTYKLEGKTVIIYFGRITEQKGLSDLITGFAKLHKNFDSSVLLVCGGTDPHFSDFSSAQGYEQECIELADKLLGNKCIFTGPIAPENKQSYFALGDVFVHPHTDLNNLVDGWGLSLNEAASMSLPIITTDRVGAAPDLVDDNKSGFIVKSGDVAGLSAKLSLLLSDRKLRNEFSARSRDVFEKYHQPQLISDRIREAMNER